MADKHTWKPDGGYFARLRTDLLTVIVTRHDDRWSVRVLNTGGYKTLASEIVDGDREAAKEHGLTMARTVVRTFAENLEQAIS